MSRRPRGAEIAAEEALPEIDRLEGFPHPRETRQLVGQQAAEQALAQASATGRMHHAWLLTGPEGIGKATLAYRFARFALQGGGGGGLFGEPPATLDAPIDSPAAALVRGLAHPGLMVVRRAYDLKRKRFPASIPIDEVRRLKPFLSLTAEAGEARVVIVDRADELNVNAANALLKSLEEPPPATTFLLISSEPGRLLVTIRSRCRRLELHPLCDADIGRAIAAPLEAAGLAMPEPPRLALLAGIARGSPRRALALVSGSGLKLYERLLAIFEALPALDQGAILKLADEVSPVAAETDLLLLFSLLEELIARLVRHSLTGTGAIGGEDRLAARLIGSRSLATWAALWETVGREKAEALALNLDRKALVMRTFLSLQDATR